MVTVNGFTLDAPSDFKTEEMTVGLRQALPGGEGGASLIIQSKPARPGASLQELANETMAELSQSLGGMKNLARTELVFADGGAGVMLSCDWVTRAGDLRQYFVMRIAGDRLCNVTVTAPRATVTQETAQKLMQTIASIRPA